MKVAIEGCAHGELEKIYEAIDHLQIKEGVKVDLLICCGDFQATRNLQDLRCMAVPIKYQQICTFYKYYSGEKTAPVLTIFIGGNHEASNYLQELPFGGWVAPNIYYLGYAGVVNIAGIKIAGLSGIYKFHDFLKGHYEKAPYTEESKRSVYHIRNIEVFRLKQLQKPVDIFISHDWPSGVYNYGNADKLLRKKPYFEKDMHSDRLGSKPCEELLWKLKPSYWFAAHLHVKFAALVPHEENEDDVEKKKTKFLALDKCLPRRQFLQANVFCLHKVLNKKFLIIDIPHDEEKDLKLEYDLEWLTILFNTNHLMSIKKSNQYMPGEGHDSRWNFTPTPEEEELVQQKFNGDFTVPINFSPTAEAYDASREASLHHSVVCQPKACINPQTTEFCKRLGIDDPMALILAASNDETDLQTTPRHPQDWNRVISYSPNRSGEVSFISTNDDEDDDDEDDVSSDDQKNISSGTAERSLSFSPPALGRLSLPSPRNISKSIFEEEEPTPACKRASTEGSGLSSFIGEGGETKESDQGQKAGDSGANSSKSGPKKFKRRNESLYVEADDDN
ncbi:hypothetical protein J437_LFUL009577 [Ladona fulva]|uniref:Lariat debranching enzyme C-terminal domain-containing protein n=1 Tax=Ladona fulva TaxID=123851 RepID=A0A8K0KAY7_LADFU|nr:hypothetical protein J437_LFUL009577 [Ladona fulva]